MKKGGRKESVNYFRTKFRIIPLLTQKKFKKGKIAIIFQKDILIDQISQKRDIFCLTKNQIFILYIKIKETGEKGEK